jgi:hypothetical protein
MDLSQFSDKDLEALSNGDMSKLNAKQLDYLAGNTNSLDRTTGEKIEHLGQVGQRAAVQGLAGGVLGLPAMVGDAFAGVGRDIAYGAKKGASKLGLAEAPDPKNYYGEGTAFPLSAKAAAAAEALPNVAGLDRPETRGERIGSAALEGAASGLSGAGVGALLARAPGVAGTVGKFLAGETGTQAAAGALGGAGAQVAGEEGATAAGQTMAGVAASMLPLVARARSGRTLSTTPAGQERIAGEIARNRVGEPNVTPTLQRLESQNVGITNMPMDAVAASRSPELAAVEPSLRTWSEGAEHGIREAQSTALDRALNAQGAAPGLAAQSRRTAQAADAAAIQDMNLSGAGDINVTGLMGDVSRQSRVGRGTGRQAPTADAMAEIRDRLARDRTSVPVYRPNPNGGPPVFSGYRSNPADLAAVRAELSEARFSAEPHKSLPTARNAARETRPILGQIDELLNEQTGGAWNQRLQDTRAARNRADVQGYMETVADLGAGGRATAEGGRDFGNFGSFLGATKYPSKPMTVPGNARGVSLNRVEQIDPQTAQNLRRMRDEVKAAQYGSEGRMANTNARAEFNTQIEQAAAQGRGTLAKVADVGLPVISSAAGGFAHLFGSAATGIGARMLGQGTKIARTQTDAAAEGIRRALGRGYADPGEMARLMRLDAPYRPTVGARATIAGSRAGLYGAQGFLAGERTSRYR